MGKAVFLNIGFVVVVIKAVTTGFAAEVCPSPPVVYASEGSNVTICWEIVPQAISPRLMLITIMALSGPGYTTMEDVAAADKNGTHLTTYEHHNKIYVGRATVTADLQSKILYLSLVNYTSEMENMYCVRYKITGLNIVRNCRSHAVFLRNTGNEYVTKAPSTVTMTTEAETTVKANTTNATSTAASTTVKRGATEARASPETNYKVAIIIMGCLLGAVTFLALFVFGLYCRIRKKPQTSQGSSAEMKQRKGLLEEKA